MRQADYVDEFIVETDDKLGAIFAARDLQAWADGKGYVIDAGAALTAHRQAPRSRVFTTERVGMGQGAFYRVVERPGQLQPSAVLRMHQQQAQEMVNRWVREYEYRMDPLVSNSKRARKLFRQAHAEVSAVATLLHVRVAGLDDDD